MQQPIHYLQAAVWRTANQVVNDGSTLPEAIVGVRSQPGQSTEYQKQGESLLVSSTEEFLVPSDRCTGPNPRG